MRRGFTLIELLVLIAVIGIGAISFNYYASSAAKNIKDTSVALPEPSGYVVDQANVLTSEQIISLAKRLEGLDKSGGPQVGIATVSSLGGLEVEEYSIKLAEKWGAGNEGYDNGIIIVLAPNERKVRVEVGYGLEGSLNDSKVGRIMDEYMIPSLKENRWYEALDGAVTGIIKNTSQDEQ